MVTTNAPKPITIDEMAEGDYCIVSSLFGTTINPFVKAKPKPSSKKPELNKVTPRDTEELDFLTTILKSTYKTVNETGYLKNLLDNYTKKIDGQVMEGIWNFSNYLYCSLEKRYSSKTDFQGLVV